MGIQDCRPCSKATEGNGDIFKDYPVNIGHTNPVQFIDTVSGAHAHIHFVPFNGVLCLIDADGRLARGTRIARTGLCFQVMLVRGQAVYFCFGESQRNKIGTGINVSLGNDGNTFEPGVTPVRVIQEILKRYGLHLKFAARCFHRDVQFQCFSIVLVVDDFIRSDQFSQCCRLHVRQASRASFCSVAGFDLDNTVAQQQCFLDGRK